MFFFIYTICIYYSNKSYYNIIFPLYPLNISISIIMNRVLAHTLQKQWNIYI